MKGIKEALSKLDRLTQEEVNLAIAQIQTVTQQIKGGVEVVGKSLNQLIEGTLAC